MDKLIPASKISAATILLVFAFLALSGASSPVHLEPPFLHVTPAEWSFENKPVARFDELPHEVLMDQMELTERLQPTRFCFGAVAARYLYYLESYPRFNLIADNPRAFQLFLHNAIERSNELVDDCFPLHLLERIMGSGNHLCNFMVGKEINDPVLLDDVNKVIELVEARHTIMVHRLFSVPTQTNSNRLLTDTYVYLMELNLGPENSREGRDFLLIELIERDPDRYDFIVEAARRNDFRAVLRTNPPCRQDWDFE